MPADRSRQNSLPAHRQAEQWIARCCFRLRLGQFLKTCADWLAVYLLCFGTAVLFVKLALPRFWPHVLWLAVGAIPVAILAWWVSRQGAFTKSESIAVLDSRLRAGGLLMTLSEAPDELWQERLPHLDSLWRASLPEFRPLRFVRQTVFPAAFLLAVCLLPEREVIAAPSLHNTAGTRATAELQELLEQMDDLKILEQEEKDELRSEIKKLVEETKQAPLTHEKWETVDALQSMMRMRVDRADATLSRARNSLARLERASKSLTETEMQEAFEELQKDVRDALSKMDRDGVFDQLSPQLQSDLKRLLKDGQLKLPGDAQDREQLLDELAEFLDEESERLDRLQEACDRCGKPGGT